MNSLPLVRLYNRVLETGEWDSGMLGGLIYPIAKKAGLCTIGNARPIALLETLQKGLTRILAQRWKRILSEHPVLERSQMAFVPGADIFDNIEVDSYLWEWARANEEELHVTYLDCSKAYESVPKYHTLATTHQPPPLRSPPGPGLGGK